MITSTLSRGLMNPHYLHERPSSISSEAWSAHQRTKHTPSTCGITFTVRVLRYTLYFMSDMCLLADVFQAIRNNSLEEYHLDPAYFVSAPQLA